MIRIYTYIILCLCAVVVVSAQDVFSLRNPSMEALPGPSKTPTFWHFCGPPQETPPDIHPSGAFGIQKEAAHGQTYLGLVVRDNGTTEKISQRLDQPLIPNQTYRFQCYAARPEIYRSISRTTMRPDSFTRAIRLRLWGVKHCEKLVLLATSPLITNTQWQIYNFEFSTNIALPGIMLEAWYEQDETDAYNGGIFIDLVSPVYKASALSIGPPNTPPLNDPTSLKGFVYQEIQKIALDNQSLPSKELIHTGDSCYYYTCLPLWDIGHVLSHSPKAKLHLASTMASALQKEAIEEALQLGGLPIQRIKWHKMKNPAKHNRWLGNDPKGVLYIGLTGI